MADLAPRAPAAGSSRPTRAGPRTRLCTKKICPPRASSLRIASRSTSVPAANEGADRQPIGRRRGDDGDLAQPAHRHLQGARDGRRGQRQHVDLRAQLLQALLVGDAEALLLVDDQQPQVLPAHVLREQPVRAHDHVELSLGQRADGLALLVFAAKARQRADAHGKIAHPLREGDEVLLGQHGGRRQHRHLPARPSPPAWSPATPPRSCHNRRRRTPAGPWAAPAPCRPARRRWPFPDRASRRRRRSPRTRGRHVGGGERVAGQGQPLGIELQQLLGHLARLDRDPPPLFLPGLAADLVEANRLALRPRRTGAPADAVDRHVDDPAVVLDVQEVLRHPAQVQALEPAVAPDPVLLVHHQIALGDLTEIAQAPGARRRGSRAAPAARRSRPRRSAPGHRWRGQAKPALSEPVSTTSGAGSACGPSNDSSVAGRLPPASGRGARPMALSNPTSRSAWARLLATRRTRSPLSRKLVSRWRRACPWSPRPAPSASRSASRLASVRRCSASSARRLVLGSASMCTGTTSRGPPVMTSGSSVTRLRAASSASASSGGSMKSPGGSARRCSARRCSALSRSLEKLRRSSS